MPLMPDSQLPPLLFADSESNADMLYFGKVFVPDAFIAFGWQGKKYAIVSRLEFNRVAKHSAFDVVLPMETYTERAKAKYASTHALPHQIIQLIMEDYPVAGWRIAQNFPAGTALELAKANVPLEVCQEDTLFPERQCKTPEEQQHIRQGNTASAAGLHVAQQWLKKAEIRRGYLYYEGKRLSSERLREAISIACLQHGALAAHTIVAGGDQACDPHCSGTGPLRANQFIIVDIFPRVTQTGYYGDMTRTFLKGQANDAQRGMAEAVNRAQKAAISEIRAGREGAQVHAAAEQVFAEANYPTRQRKDGAYEGFFHSTGHGLGLDIHEFPRLARNSSTLREGMVVTVEPGLYYPGIGGFRTEDVVCVTEQGWNFLSSFNYRWEIS